MSTNTTNERLDELLGSLPPGALRLVDNRIVAGDSTWAMRQPKLVANLRTKVKPDTAASIRAILNIVNIVREARAIDDPTLH